RPPGGGGGPHAGVRRSSGPEDPGARTGRGVAVSAADRGESGQRPVPAAGPGPSGPPDGGGDPARRGTGDRVGPGDVGGGDEAPAPAAGVRGPSVLRGPPGAGGGRHPGLFGGNGEECNEPGDGPAQEGAGR